MRIKSSRRYYIPLYILSFVIFLFFHNILPLIVLVFSIIAVEVYINTHYLEIRDDEIYIYQGLINKKTIRLEKGLVHEVTLEKNLYLFLLGLSTLKLRSLDKEYKISGIKNGEEIFKKINSFLKGQKL